MNEVVLSDETIRNRTYSDQTSTWIGSMMGNKKKVGLLLVCEMKNAEDKKNMKKKKKVYLNQDRLASKCLCQGGNIEKREQIWELFKEKILWHYMTECGEEESGKSRTVSFKLSLVLRFFFLHTKYIVTFLSFVHWRSYFQTFKFYL